MAGKSNVLMRLLGDMLWTSVRHKREAQQVSQRINERLQILKYTILLLYYYIFQAFIH